MVTGVKVPQYEIIETGVEPYEHLGIEKGGQQIHEAKVAWLELLKRLILIIELRVDFTLMEYANKSATKRKNVLAKTVTPRIVTTLEYILSELEEQSREETFRLKRVKQKKTKKPNNQNQEPSCTCKMLQLDDENITEMIYPKGTKTPVRNASVTTVASKHSNKSQKSYDDEDKKQLDYLLSHVDEIVHNLVKQNKASKSTEKFIETYNNFKGSVKSLSNIMPSQSFHPPQQSKVSSSSSKGDNAKKAWGCGRSCYSMTTQETERDTKHTSPMRSTVSEYHRRCLAPQTDQKKYMSLPQSKTDEYLKIYMTDDETSAEKKNVLCPICNKKPRSDNIDRIEHMSAAQSKSEEFIKKHLLHQNKPAGSEGSMCSVCGKNTKICITPNVQERIQYMSAPQSKSEEYVKNHLLHTNKWAESKKTLCSKCGKKGVSVIAPDVQERIQYMSAPQSKSEEYIKMHLLHQNKSDGSKKELCSDCVKKVLSGIAVEVQERIVYMSAPESESEEYMKKYLSRKKKSTGSKELLCTICASKTGKNDEFANASKSSICSKIGSTELAAKIKSPSRVGSTQKDNCCKVASKEKQKAAVNIDISCPENCTPDKENEKKRDEKQPPKPEVSKKSSYEKCSERQVDTEINRISSCDYHKRCFPENPQKSDICPDSSKKSNEANKQNSCSVCSSQEKLCPTYRSGATEAIWRDTWTSTTDLEIVPSTMPSKSTLKQSSKSKSEHSCSAIKIIAKQLSPHKSDKNSMSEVSASSECLTCNYTSKTKSLNDSERDAPLCRQCRNKFDSTTKRSASESNVCRRCQANFEKSISRTNSNRWPRCKKENSASKHICPICQSENSTVSDFQGGLSLGSDKSKCYLCGKERKDTHDIDSLRLKCSILSYIKSKLLNERTDDDIPCPRCNARKAAERCQTACLLCKKRMSKSSKSSEDSNGFGLCTSSNKSRAPESEPCKLCASSNSPTYTSDDEEVCCGTQTVVKHSCKFDDNVQVASIPDPNKTGESPVPRTGCAANTKEVGVNTKNADRYDVRPVHLLSRNTSRSSCYCKPRPSLKICRCKSSPTCKSKHKSLRDVRSSYL